MTKKKMWTVERRKKTLEKCRKMLHALEEVEYSKAVAVLAMNTGHREQKIKEYVELFERADIVTVEKGSITYNDTDTPGKISGDTD